MQSIAGFLKKKRKGYFLPHTQKMPEEAFYLKIWPKTDIWLKHIKTYHLNRANNEVIQLNLAGSGFLHFLCILRVILLQDLVVLCKQFPLYPLWKDPLFGCKEYQRFTTQIKSLLVSVVMLNKLIIQKYWPIYKTIAKLRHKTIILEINRV